MACDPGRQLMKDAVGGQLRSLAMPACMPKMSQAQIRDRWNEPAPPADAVGKTRKSDITNLPSASRRLMTDARAALHRSQVGDPHTLDRHDVVQLLDPATRAAYQTVTTLPNMLKGGVLRPGAFGKMPTGPAMRGRARNSKVPVSLSPESQDTPGSVSMTACECYQPIDNGMECSSTDSSVTAGCSWVVSENGDSCVCEYECTDYHGECSCHNVTWGSEGNWQAREKCRDAGLGLEAESGSVSATYDPGTGTCTLQVSCQNGTATVPGGSACCGGECVTKESVTLSMRICSNWIGNIRPFVPGPGGSNTGPEEEEYGSCDPECPDTGCEEYREAASDCRESLGAGLRELWEDEERSLYADKGWNCAVTCYSEALPVLYKCMGGTCFLTWDCVKSCRVTGCIPSSGTPQGKNPADAYMERMLEARKKGVFKGIDWSDCL